MRKITPPRHNTASQSNLYLKWEVKSQFVTIGNKNKSSKDSPGPPNFMGTLTAGHKDLLETTFKTDLYRGGSEVLLDLSNEWLRLCESGGCNSPYNRPEYYSAYVRAFEPRSTLAILTVRAAGELVALLPLVEATEIWYGIPIRLLTTPRDDHYSWFDLICSARIDLDRVCEEVVKELIRVDCWDAVRLRYVAEKSAAYRLLEAAAKSGLSARSIKVNSVPYITVEPSNGDLDRYFGTRSANFRHMMRKAMRRADKAGGVTLREYATADSSALHEFYRLEASGWKGKAGTAIICNSHLLDFYNALAEAAVRGGYFRLYLLDLGSRAIAGMFAFQMDGTLYFPKIGYDEEYKAFAPGHLLVYAILKTIWNGAVSKVDFLGAWMRWKGHWTQEGCPSWDIHFYRRNLRARVIEKIRFGLMPMARDLYRRARSSEQEDEE